MVKVKILTGEERDTETAKIVKMVSTRIGLEKFFDIFANAVIEDGDFSEDYAIEDLVISVGKIRDIDGFPYLLVCIPTFKSEAEDIIDRIIKEFKESEDAEEEKEVF